MAWWGKIIGAVFGFMLTWGNPLGALIGLLVGNLFDRGFQLNVESQAWHSQTHSQHQIQRAFFKASFLVMGHVAKSDGRISEGEIRVARAIMRKMQLNHQQRQEAIAFFTTGKQPYFKLLETLTDFMRICGAQKNLLRMFIDIQYQAAMADGWPGLEKQQVLGVICQQLGFAPIFTHYHQQQHQYQQESQRHYQKPTKTLSLDQAFALLEIEKTASKFEIKRAYRKQMSMNHPDKLIAQGLPEEMVKLATDKTQKIQAAYEKIKKHRRFK